MIGITKDADKPIYYVYAWYYVDTGEIFYVGKGKNERYRNRKDHRNKYFINILEKHGNNVDVKLLKTGMTESEALAEEKALISYYWSIGQCKANFHEGGCGGYTGNYYKPERIEKLREIAKRRTGPKNGMYGRTHTKEVREFLSKINKGKKMPEAHKLRLRMINTGRVKTEEERKKISLAQKGRKHKKEQTLHSNQAQTKNIYEIYYDGTLMCKCIGYVTLIKFCKKYLSVSRTILPDKILNVYKPKFNRHKWMDKLNIVEIDKDEYQNWKEIFKDEMYVIQDRQKLDDLMKLIKEMYIESKINRYGSFQSATV